MLNRLLTLLGVRSAVVPDHRSPEWPRVRTAWLHDHPTCAACGRGDHLEVHHKIPFQMAPGLELDPANFITLCEAPSINCHLNDGHLGDWKAYNPDVEHDAAAKLSKRQSRPYHLLPYRFQ